MAVFFSATQPFQIGDYVWMKVTGLIEASSLEAKGTVRGSVLRSGQRFGFPPENTLERTSLTLGPASAVELSEVRKREADKRGTERSRGSDCDPNSSLSLSLFCPPLHRHLTLPEVTVLVSAQHCGTSLRAPPDGRWQNAEEEACRLVCVFWPDEGQELCQETCAMSLTRVWMSCRHSGHVSNCKAHSIHIPLQSRERERGKNRFYSYWWES